MFQINRFQKLFIEQERWSGNPSSNQIRGCIEITGKIDEEKFINAVETVLETNRVFRLFFLEEKECWLEGKLNGSFCKGIDCNDPENPFEVSLGTFLWSVGYINTGKVKRLSIVFHHALFDGYSLNNFWLEICRAFDEKCYVPHILNFLDKEKEKVPGWVAEMDKIKSSGYRGKTIRVSINIERDLWESSFKGFPQIFDWVEASLKPIERHTGEKLRICLPLHNRRTIEDKRGLCGFVNFVPVPPWGSTKSRLRKAYRLARVPLLALLEHTKNNPVANVMLSYQNISYPGLAGEGIQTRVIYLPPDTDENFLSIHILNFNKGGYVQIALDYNPAFISGAGVQWILSYLRDSLLIKDQAKFLSLMDTRLSEATGKSSASGDLLDVLIRTVEQKPQKTALIFKGKKISYREIFNKVRKKADSELSKHEVGSVINLCGVRDEKLIVNILASWLCGLVTYLTLSGIKKDEKIEKSSVLAPQGKPFLYKASTSGTTGAPKTFMISKLAAESNQLGWESLYKCKEGIHLSLAHQTFDVFYGDVIRSILSGGTLILAGESERVDPIQVMSLIEIHKVTHLETTPSFAELMIRQTRGWKFIKCFILGSEKISARAVREISRRLKGVGKVYNSYGLTECCIDTTAGKLTGEGNGKELYHCGQPLPRQSVCIKNEGRVVPIGFYGEVVISGVGVANPVKKDERFVTRGDKIEFHSGDVGFMDDKKNLFITGRKNDEFLKVSGRRIPAKDIEESVSSLEGVTQAIVLACGERVILFYLGSRRKNDVRSYLENFFSYYQCPEEIRKVENIPMTQNGKIDKEKLKILFLDEKQDRNPWFPEAPELKKIIDKIDYEGLSPIPDSGKLIRNGWSSLGIIKLAGTLSEQGLRVTPIELLQASNPGALIEDRYHQRVPVSLKKKLLSSEAEEYNESEMDEILNSINS